MANGVAVAVAVEGPCVGDGAPVCSDACDTVPLAADRA